MAPRAYWKGYLKLSLVSCPIALYPASSSSERVSFNRINTRTGNRLKQQMVDAESGEPVGKEDIGRGYEYAKGQYLLVEDDELEKIKIESTHTIEIDSFVPRSEVDDRYLSSPYYLSPTDQVGQEAFSVIRDAMREKKVVGLARVVLTRREHVAMLEPFDKGLLATTLRYQYEIRDHAEYFEDIPDLKLPAEMKKLAAHIVDTKSGHFEPKSHEDHYEKALVELVEDQGGRQAHRGRGRGTGGASRDQSDGCLAGEHRCQRQEAGGGQHRIAPGGQEEGSRALTGLGRRAGNHSCQPDQSAVFFCVLWIPDSRSRPWLLNRATPRCSAPSLSLGGWRRCDGRRRSRWCVGQAAPRAAVSPGRPAFSWLAGSDGRSWRMENRRRA